MYEICGYINSSKTIERKYLRHMIEKLDKNIVKKDFKYIEEHIALGQILPEVNKKNKIYEDDKYIVIVDGEIFNIQEISKDLKEKGYKFVEESSAEYINKAYIEYGATFLDILNGAFVICILEKIEHTIFIARDKLGLKSIYYTKTEDEDYVFATEIKGLLAYRGVYPVLNKQAAMELIGLGPAHTPGLTYYKDIYEIEPGQYAYIKDNNITKHTYWDIEEVSKNIKISDNIEQAERKIRYILKDAVKKQSECINKSCSMLSGGLDSSILTKILSEKEKSVDTFSIDFKDNDKNFKSTEYQSTADKYYVDKMVKYLKTTHMTVLLENKELFNALSNSLIARDSPGMADIDASLYLFCKNIRECGHETAFSGECSDEIFGGYPWFYKEKLMKYDGFPWAMSEKLRENIINKNISGMTKYVRKKYENEKNKVKKTDENNFENRYKEINYLTIKFFMPVLIERVEKMARANNLEIRVPFADYRIFEYVYNLDVKYKLGDEKNKEKYILRKAFESELPEEIVYRKKSPFPKTYDVEYLKILENAVAEMLKSKDNKIFKILDKEYIKQIIESHGREITENFFGQLMTYPQILAYIIQIDIWLEVYDVIIDL
ncbi:MAG: asparagine synthase (glutamine-hydrolyzing) [Clostridia bacterium]